MVEMYARYVARAMIVSFPQPLHISSLLGACQTGARSDLPILSGDSKPAPISYFLKNLSHTLVHNAGELCYKCQNTDARGALIEAPGAFARHT